MSRARAFTFTINNYTDEDVDMLLDAKFKYLCFGFEKGSKNQKPHIQGYIYMWDPKTIAQVSKKVMPRAHIEISRGTVKDNEKYTSKEGDWYQFGEPPAQGQAQWDKIEQVMDDPKSNPHLYNQYSKMYRQLTLGKKKDHERRIYAIPYDSRYVYAKEHDTVMFDSLVNDTYDGEEAIFVGPYDNSNWIKDWVNGYPHKVKRGYELICVDPEVIYIMYDNEKEKNYILKVYIDLLDGVF